LGAALDPKLSVRAAAEWSGVRQRRKQETIYINAMAVNATAAGRSPQRR
jgi:hypothetical protein